MKYIWQHPDWPNFVFNRADIQLDLYRYAMDSARLAGGIDQLTGGDQTEASIDLLVAEAIKSSQIEGEQLNREDVRSSLRNYLGLNAIPERVGDPRAEGIAALLVDARNTFMTPLNCERLCYWHELVIPHDTDIFGRQFNKGAFRNSAEPMQIVSGPVGYEQIHYEAPPAKDVPDQMVRFLEWYNQTGPNGNIKMPGPVRAAIAHVWFELIHPFEDGNGRIGRAVADVALAQDLQRPSLLSLSVSIEKKRDEYYEQLGQVSRGDLDISAWVEWFVRTVTEAQMSAKDQVNFVLSKARFFDQYGDKLNDRQLKAITKMFDAGVAGFTGGMTAKKYMSITRSSKATATRDLSELLEFGCFVKSGAGRSVSYDLNINVNQQPAASDDISALVDRIKAFKPNASDDQDSSSKPGPG